jgi:hypothetical protein
MHDSLIECQELAALCENWQQATREYAAAVEALPVGAVNCSSAEYARMMECLEEKRLTCEAARSATASHKQEHGC